MHQSAEHEPITQWTLAAMRAWAAAQPPGALVGVARDAGTCPVANAARAYFRLRRDDSVGVCTLIAASRGTTPLLYIERLSDAPPGAIYQITEAIDAQAPQLGHPVSREDFLAVLDQLHAEAPAEARLAEEATRAPVE